MRNFGFVFVGAAFAAALLAHCGVAPAYGSQSSCLSSDGQCGADAGTAPVDAGTAACQCPVPPKPVVLEAPCDKTVVTQQNANGTLTAHYAVLDAPTAQDDGTMIVQAVICGHTCNGGACPAKCFTDDSPCDEDMSFTPDCMATKGLLKNGTVTVLCGKDYVDPQGHSGSDIYAIARIDIP